jgi:Fe-S-cluster containining protein
MGEIKGVFSPVFNEVGFKTQIDWNLSRRDFTENLKKLFSDLKKLKAAIPLPVTFDIGPVTCLLAGVDCKGCPGFCCTRVGHKVLLSDQEARKFNTKNPHDNHETNMLPLPCKYFKKGQCSIYADRPAACRLYPIQAGGTGAGTTGQNIIIGLDSLCPVSSRLALRVYLATYDLASLTLK